MKQVFQNLKTGQVEFLDIPTPTPSKGHVLIQTSVSLLSPGTERMLADFGKAGWVSKARQQPEKVRQVLEKIRVDGLEATTRAVFTKLDKPLPLGYCNVGKVVAVGSDVNHLQVGDRVVSNGSHAELVSVPENLCAKIPASVSDVDASFAVLGAIALQGVRLAKPELGETFAVMGLGVIGLLTCQLLKANGCKVVAFDYNASRVDLAKSLGAEGFVLGEESDPLQFVENYTESKSLDGVVIAASSKSNAAIELAPKMCRKRGRVVLVGVVGLNLSRSDFYEKEISFQVSCSYGPGRYESAYEQQGLDYPVGFVRWTAQRNFRAVLELIASSGLNVQPLVSEEVEFSDLETRYDSLLSDNSGIGYCVKYRSKYDPANRVVPVSPAGEVSGKSSTLNIAFIGSGNYMRSMLLPAFSKTSAKLRAIVSRSGIDSADLARKYSIAYNSTDVDGILSDKDINAVVIATPHNSHADLAARAMKAGKHVFVEKPLCLTLDELSMLESLQKENSEQVLLVGFNRREAPLVQKCKHLLKNRHEPLCMTYTVNAGSLPANSDHHQRASGGGRIIGEACHFIDLLSYLADTDIVEAHCAFVPVKSAAVAPDNITISLLFADGSIGNVNYFANGNKALAKERLEIFYGQKVLQLDNFRKLRGFGFNNFKSKSLWRQDKGQQNFANYFVDLCTGSMRPSNDRLFNVMRTTIEISDQTIGDRMSQEELVRPKVG